MSRATALAALPRDQVMAAWIAAFPDRARTMARWLAIGATKEQLVAQIVTREEQQCPTRS